MAQLDALTLNQQKPFVKIANANCGLFPRQRLRLGIDYAGDDVADQIIESRDNGETGKRRTAESLAEDLQSQIAPVEIFHLNGKRRHLQLSRLVDIHFSNAGKIYLT